MSILDRYDDLPQYAQEAIYNTYNEVEIIKRDIRSLIRRLEASPDFNKKLYINDSMTVKSLILELKNIVGE
jgi:hypothetical protein